MILFLHGADTFTSQEKLITLRDRFLQKNGASNILVLWGDEISRVEILRNAVQTLPFLGTKRLVIVRDLNVSKPSKELCDELVTLLPAIPDHTILLIYESAHISNTANAFVKSLLQLAQTEECVPYKSSQMSQWITRRIQSLGGRITPAATALLVQIVGSDLWRAHHEVEKLAMFRAASSEPISETDVQLLSMPTAEADIFKFLDALGRRDARQAVRELRAVRASGMQAFYLLSMIAYQIRILLQAHEAHLSHGNAATLARDAAMNPYVAQKALQQAGRFSASELRTLFQEIAMIDRKGKSGLCDVDTALDLLTVRICTNADTTIPQR